MVMKNPSVKRSHYLSVGLQKGVSPEYSLCQDTAARRLEGQPGADSMHQLSSAMCRHNRNGG